MKKIYIVGLALASLVVAGVVWHFQQPPPEQPFGISKYELLEASDVADVALEAIRDGQTSKLNVVQQRVVDVAKEMGMTTADVDFLNSEQAIDYLVFNAKRALFDQELERAFANLNSIEDIKQRYPEAQDRFSHADAIIAKRDQLFTLIVQSLVQQGIAENVAKQQAKQLWIERFKTSDALEPLPN